MRKPPAKKARTDVTGRRYSFVRQPKRTKPFIPKEVHLACLEFLHRHGDLPTPFLQKYLKLKHFLKNPQTVSVLLKDLFHETNTPHGGAYIDRPPQQLKTEKPESNYVVHKVSKYGIKVLKEHNMFHENTPKSSSSWEHDFLRACYSASIELACLEESKKYRYIHHDTVINNVIDKTGKYPVFEDKGEEFEPDVMQGIHYLKTNTVRLSPVEIDMMTESITSKSNKTKTIEQSLRQYRNFIKKGKYKKVFAFSGGFFLTTITINYTHARNMMKVADKEPFFLFNWVPGFEYYVKPPPPMPWLFTEPYERKGHEPFSICTP